MIENTLEALERAQTFLRETRSPPYMRASRAERAPLIESARAQYVDENPLPRDTDFIPRWACRASVERSRLVERIEASRKPSANSTPTLTRGERRHAGDQRALVVWRLRQDGMKLVAIACLLDVSVTTVRGLVYRGEQYLKRKARGK